MHHDPSRTRLDVLQDCVAQAVLAPSLHNSQPWRFRLSSAAVDLIADRSRWLPLSDPQGRQLTISCGAALFTLRVAAAAQGLGCAVELLPHPHDPDLLARVSFSDRCAPDIDAAAELARAIRERHTSRRPFAPAPIDARLLGQLMATVRSEGAMVAALDTPALRTAAVDLVTQADERLWSDPGWRRELSHWMHPDRQGDGMYVPGPTQLAAELITRSFDLGNGVAARHAQVLEGSPLLLLLGTAADTPVEWLRCGQALQHLLLFACTRGIFASFLNQPTYDARTRMELQARCASAGVPQVLLRLGFHAGELHATPRRTASSVLEVDWTQP